jgi:hypothetical protein
MKTVRNPTLRKLRNRKLVAIRYRTPEEVRHGWIVSEKAGAMIVRLIGEDRNRKLTCKEARFVTRL